MKKLKAFLNFPLTFMSEYFISLFRFFFLFL